MTTSTIETPLIRIPVVPNAATGIEQPGQIMIDKVTTMSRAGEHAPQGWLTARG